MAPTPLLRSADKFVAHWQQLALLLALALWFGLDGLLVSIGSPRQELHLHVDAGDWQWPTFPPLLLCLAAVAVSWARKATHPGAMALLTAGLLGLRLLSLGSSFTLLLPWSTLLWSPHASWALALTYLAWAGRLRANWPSRLVRPFGSIAAVIFVVGIGAYGIYTLYFCQVTMLHGDESHYLQQTYSLLHDNDIDLTNNCSDEVYQEFHIVSFEPHKAPSSPPGRLHSTHPVGPAAVALPGYWFGLKLWSNPRLGAALFFALLAAACLPLLWLWLVRLEFSPPLALVCVAIAATTTPFFVFSNQIYPELPGLLITLAILVGLSHWQRPGGTHHSLGPKEPLVLGFFTLLLGLLPFLHPRFIVPAAPLGLLVLLQAWRAPQRRALVFVGVATLFSACALLGYNLHYSDSWMGAFQPGNAWDKQALQLSTWPLSLPGHWLELKVGLLNSSPIFALCIFGWLDLARRRDRRLGLAAVLYLATTGVNGLHPNWPMGYCFPARFLLPALPALLIGLAAGLRLCLNRPFALYAVALALAISLETTLTNLALPERGLTGDNLAQARTVNDYYPLGIHFFSHTQTTLVWPHLLFGLVLAAGLYGPRLIPQSKRPILAAVGIALAGLTPFFWGQTQTGRRSLATHLSPLIAPLDQGAIAPLLPRPAPRLRPFVRNTGSVRQDRGFQAQQGRDQVGYLSSYYLPPAQKGFYRLVLGDLQTGPPDHPPSHLLVRRRTCLPSLNPWEQRLSWPLRQALEPKDQFFPFDSIPLSLGYAHIIYSGRGQLALRNVKMEYLPYRGRENLNLVGPLAVKAVRREEPGFAHEAFIDHLDKGRYKIRFHVNGSSLSTFFERRPKPVVLALFAAPPGDSDLPYLAQSWFAQDHTSPNSLGLPVAYRPQTESLLPPWWASIPLAATQAYELDFMLNKTNSVFAQIHYQGPAPLRVDGASLYRVELD